MLNVKHTVRHVCADEAIEMISEEIKDLEAINHRQSELLKRALKMLKDTHNAVTKHTGQNGMSPHHDQWIQDLFESLEILSTEIRDLKEQEA